jgi:hypothetical protein
MAVNFPSNPSDGDTVLTGTKLYTYHSSKGVWKDSDGDDVTQSTLDNYLEVANSSSIGVTTYSALSDLPLSGQSTGKMAYVSGTNRLYLWAGSGWYNIALVNTDPSISGASSTYNLDTGGANTVVTLASSDPEGLPISFSVSHSGIGVGANAIATVTQSNNIFTFTPTTNTALAGTFTTTFTASDGVNVAVANSSFTLTFTVNNSNYTTALITSVGTNNQVNNTFVDSSTNSHTITGSGDVTQTTFSPYRHGGYSVYCDGSDAVKFNETASDEFTFGTGDFTLEGWFWIDLASIAAGGEHTLIGNNGTDGELWFSIIGSNWSGPKYNFQTGTGSGWNTTVSSSTNTVTLKEWVHLAVVRDSGTVTIYENGTSVASGSNSDNIPNTNSMLSFMGRPQTYGQYATGYIHDVRITKGEAVYTSSFTPPTEKMSAGANTKLLAFRKPYIIDESSSSLSVTLDTGDPSVEAYAPYDYETYSATDNGGSMYFDGNGDGVSAANHTSFDIGSGDFTIETWFYSSNPDNGYIFGKGDSTTASGTSFWMSGGSGTGLYLFHGGSYTVMQTGALPVNQWTHLAFVRNGTNLSTYINGTSVHSTTASITVNTTSNELDIGYYPATAWIGNLEDFRFVKGTAVYTSNFTPPTAPLTAITNTSLLLQGTNAGIIDKSQSVKSLTLNGDTKSSTTQSKYLTSSMYFDGTGDYITIPDNNLHEMGSADFTVEVWVYCTGDPGTWQVLVGKGASGIYSPFALYRNSDGNGYLFGSTNGTSWAVSNSFGALSTNTWYHLALTRSGNTWTVYKDGVSSYSTTISGSVYNNSTALGIGGRSDNTELFQGYMSDVRITKGLARYTSSFTPPTSALLG